ncbi:MAG: YggT family protein [Alphaproteobacteria bacterium]
MDTSFWDYWYFHLPNYALAVLIYTMLARVLLGLFVPPAWDNYIWRAFQRLTDPVLATFGTLTPRSVPRPLLIGFTVVWLMLLRVALFVLFLELGIAPGIEIPATQG